MKIGTLVRCNNDLFTPYQVSLIPNRPIKGNFYTIKDVLLTRHGKGIILEELENPLLPLIGIGTFTPSFSINRFSELNTELKNEISSTTIQSRA